MAMAGVGGWRVAVGARGCQEEGDEKEQGDGVCRERGRER